MSWEIGLFLGLSLSLGMGHGALDVLLLRHDARPMRAMLIYGASVLGFAAVLANFSAFALVMLLVMSIWHFGEQGFAADQAFHERWLMRCALGGASVMWPMLLSAQALLALLQSTWSTELVWIVLLWKGLAGLWIGVLLVSLILMVKRKQFQIQLIAEVIALAVLNVLLPPLLAFTLFFGLYHSPLHILRVRSFGSVPNQAWIITLLITWLAMALLAGMMWAQRDALIQEAAWWLRWMVVALTAVTLPHLVLVSQANKLLHRPIASPH
ncbi:MAG: beta-carotene 15,15'-dioxygenase, Brp/Blh family [Brachymonas sp.]|nr:beta-carotene 15,15'-dioxygenase, Brp/Blh family [Brachymonas sp.]